MPEADEYLDYLVKSVRISLRVEGHFGVHFSRELHNKMEIFI